MPTFVERLDARARRWWGTDAGAWHVKGSFRDRARRWLRQPQPLHRLQEVFARRSPADPDAVWHCCANWQRTLGDKATARVFAQRHGCRVPELYWMGRNLGRAPWHALPDHYVVRPTYSGGRRGTHVMDRGRDALRGVDHTPASLQDELRRAGWWRTVRPVLIEERLRDERGDYALLTEYKCYVFGAHLAAIEAVTRQSDGTATQRYYSAEWVRQPLHLNYRAPPGPDVPPPRCLDELVDTAIRLGRAWGTFVRVDLYATDHGCVFGEFSNRPNGGQSFTPESDRLLGDLWARHLPDEPV